MPIGTYATVVSVKRRLASSDTYSTDDDFVLQSLCDGINGWIDLKAQRILGPINGASYLFDAADWSEGGTVLNIPYGIRSVTTLKIAQTSGATLQLIPSTEYHLLPRTQHRQPGYPATQLFLHNSGGTAPIGRVYSGYGVVEIVGDFGFDAIPPEIRELAETAVVRAWHGRQAGQTDIIGSDENGQPIVSHFVALKDTLTLTAYHPYGGVMIA